MTILFQMRVKSSNWLEAKVLICHWRYWGSEYLTDWVMTYNELQTYRKCYCIGTASSRDSVYDLVSQRPSVIAPSNLALNVKCHSYKLLIIEAMHGIRIWMPFRLNSNFHAQPSRPQKLPAEVWILADRDCLNVLLPFPCNNKSNFACCPYPEHRPMWWCHPLFTS